LDAAIGVFGRFGFKKRQWTTWQRREALQAGLYLHFTSKEEIFTAAIRKYLADGLRRVEQELSNENAMLLDRLAGAMDAWFGRHIETFDRAALDVIDAGIIWRRPKSTNTKRRFASGLPARWRVMPSLRVCKQLARRKKLRRCCSASASLEGTEHHARGILEKCFGSALELAANSRKRRRESHESH